MTRPPAAALRERVISVLPEEPLGGILWFWNPHTWLPAVQNLRSQLCEPLLRVPLQLGLWDRTPKVWGAFRH